MGILLLPGLLRSLRNNNILNNLEIRLPSPPLSLPPKLLRLNSFAVSFFVPTTARTQPAEAEVFQKSRGRKNRRPIGRPLQGNGHLNVLPFSNQTEQPSSSQPRFLVELRLFAGNSYGRRQPRWRTLPKQGFITPILFSEKFSPQLVPSHPLGTVSKSTWRGVFYPHSVSQKSNRESRSEQPPYPRKAP